MIRRYLLAALFVVSAYSLDATASQGNVRQLATLHSLQADRVVALHGTAHERDVKPGIPAVTVDYDCLTCSVEHGDGQGCTDSTSLIEAPLVASHLPSAAVARASSTTDHRRSHERHAPFAFTRTAERRGLECVCWGVADALPAHRSRGLV